MNKSELVAALAEKNDFSKKDAEKALNAFVDVIAASLAKNEKVQLIGFGIRGPALKSRLPLQRLPRSKPARR